MASPTPTGFFTSGGCLLMSRLPLRDKSATVFTHYSKPIDHGLSADGFAAKGVLHARIVRGDGNQSSSIDVYVTHLEARAGKLRPKQYAQLAEFIRKTSAPERPFLLLGDLKPVATAVRLFRDPKVIALSDHNAVTATLQWSFR